MPTGDDAAGARPLDVRLLVPALAAWAALAALVTGGPGRLLPVAALSLFGTGVLVAATLVRGAPAGPRRSGPRPGPRPPGLPLLALTLATTALVLLCGSAQLAVQRAGTVLTLATQQATVRATGTVLTEPRVVQRGDGRPDLVVLTLRVEHVVGRGQASDVASPVLVFADSNWKAVPWRSTVGVTGRLAPAEPGDDVLAVLSPRGPPAVIEQPGAVLRAAEVARHRLREAVDPLPRDARGLVPGLVIGDTSLTPPELRDAMLATGMTHLSAVSGSNVAIVLGAVVLLCGWLGVPRRWRPAVAVLCLLGFVLLCRPEPSVLRAGTMGVVGLLALTTSRRRVSLPALAAAVVVLLCADPWLARSYGFALSTLATLGLVLFARPWGDAIGRRLPTRLALLGDAVAIPLAAQVACGPVVVLLQGSVSTVAVVANLLAAPLVAPTTIAGILAAVVSPFSAPLGGALAWLAAPPAWLIGRVARWCAVVPMGTLDWVEGARGAWLLAAVTVLGLLTGPWLLHRARMHPWWCGAALLGALALVWPVPDRGWPPPGWLVVGCDVGQGDAFVIATGPGRAVVVDVGPDPVLVRRCLDRLHVSRVDAVVLSHFHVDHVGGLDGLLDREVAAAYLTTVRDPPEQAARTVELLARAGVPAHHVRAGEHLAWGQVTAEVVWPARAITEGSVANNGSIVLDVRARSVRLLFTGDIEPEAAREVRRRLAGERFDVLKVAHHGSAAQDEPLVRASGARVALIGVGADNTFGHPAPSALSMLARTGAVVLRTDRHGDVAVVLEAGGRLSVATRGGGR